LPQAHRVKTEPPAIRAGLTRFLQGIFREISFWLVAAIALAMTVALATFHPADPAWTHTANVTRIQNAGGVAGAWFADILLYFFGYPAYLLPLGLLWAGWRLFKCGALLELDAEIVFFRVLGFAVALTTAGGLATVHLHTTPATLPGTDASAGGLVGVYVSRFLIEAFGYGWGNLLMVVLLLAGVTLATSFSWLKLLDWVGGVVLRGGGLFGGPPKKPPKQPSRSIHTPPDDPIKPSTKTASSKPDNTSMEKRTAVVAHWMGRGLGGMASLVRAGARAGWRAGRAAFERKNTVEPDSVAGDQPGFTPTAEPPSPVAQEMPSSGMSRHGGRIEPVLHLPHEREERVAVKLEPRTPVAVPDSPRMPLSDLTLLPSAVPAPKVVTRSVPTLPPPSRNAATMAPAVEVPWVVAERFSEPASNDPITVAPALIPQGNTLSAVATPPVASMVRRVALPQRPQTNALPSLDLLDRPVERTSDYSSATLEDMSRHVEALLKSFGIAARVVAVEPGPVITRFEVDPAPGVKVSQISNLAKDLARGLSVISVRVVEVIPGKSVIGLEIPNRKRQMVYLREVLEAPIYTQSASPLTLALGMDIGGNPVVANLGKMPHLLVAGTTGSGKSVAINAMLLSLLYKASPTEVRLILVDPKMLELSMYEDIPHLLTPVVTDMKEAANALRWCVGEMERRYRLMAALKVRNIAGFNRKIEDALAEGETLPDPFWKPDGASGGEIPALQSLPFVVVVIDELADMMMVVGKKVEELIARLAQKARAAGIHLILATQRPSVDVITGLIKANIPTRVAFQVSSKVDSRTILDQMGAEQLLGHGDMLYLPPGTGLPQRVHGAFVDDHEVNQVVDYLRQTGTPDYIDDVLVEPREEDEGSEEGETGGRGGESDPLYDDAVRIVTESRRASVSGVQRRLRIGYNRAARLVEEMEVAGVVGPLQSNGSREVLAPPPP
jgi:S-DNA-T family DNA segregation ATPase FtsK/SpoIIIE